MDLKMKNLRSQICHAIIQKLELPLKVMNEKRSSSRSTMEINSVGIVGAGQMGRRIAQIVSSAGLHALLYDMDDKILEEARHWIERRLDQAVQQRKLTEWVKEKTLKNITVSTRPEDLSPCNFLIESVPEKEEFKIEVFEIFDEICENKTIFASNTSSLSITRLASVTDRPDRFIGIHFLNPDPAIKIVEMIRGISTSEETLQKSKEFVERLGKTVVLSKDSPGFMVNRILLPMINEAIFAVMEGVGTVEQIDTAFSSGIGHPMGPLALADFIGLDVCLDIMEILYTEFCDSKYRPAPLLRKYVEAGFLGRKTGQGFYLYPKESQAFEHKIIQGPLPLLKKPRV